MTQQEFVQKYLPVAQAAVAGTTLLPETVITVAGLESNWGNSKLAAIYNNFFGIKAGSSWRGNVVDLPTYEYVNGQKVLVHDYFRAYSSPEESFRDFVSLITGLSRYKSVLQMDTVKSQFDALQAAGYSTNPNYSRILLSVFNDIKGFLTSQGGGLAAIIVVGIIAAVYFLGRSL